MNHRHDVTDAQWSRLAPLLPPNQPAGGGKPNGDHRTVLNGICWRLRTGAPWRDVPARYGTWATLSSRFRRWQQAGIWDQVLAALLATGDAAGASKGAVIKRSAAVKAAARPRSTSAPKVVATRSPERGHRASAMRPRR
jgi:transposase